MFSQIPRADIRLIETRVVFELEMIKKYKLGQEINRNKSCIWIVVSNCLNYEEGKINRNKSCIWILRYNRVLLKFPRLIETRVVFELGLQVWTSLSNGD